ncbi:hypothetical protein HED60_03835 [Planctomycetales bacterium ZRK34]|nr:hypothetical protein HED60_03835 [Planctomycetales bacterium ZRK34]
MSLILLVFGLIGLLNTAAEAQQTPQPDLQQMQRQIEQLQHEVQRLRPLEQEVATLRATNEETWLTERRAEEVKALIREVLSDADTRASLADGGMTAGHNGKTFYLASEDGNYLMKIGGRFQIRYIYTDAPGAGTSPAAEADENESGFQLRRVWLHFIGHIGDPKLKYAVWGGFSRSTGNFQIWDAYLSYDFDEHFSIRAGQTKVPFMHEEQISSRFQMAVERANYNEFFTADYSQGVMVEGTYDHFGWKAMVHDGREGANVDWSADSTDVGLAGRVEFMPFGKWAQFKDFVAWSDDPAGLLFGAAIDYELGEGGADSTQNYTSLLGWTADASLEVHPFSLYASVVGRHVQGVDNVAGKSSVDQFGTELMAAVFIIPDKFDVFGRFEWIDHDHVNEIVGDPGVNLLPTGLVDDVKVFTVGGNWYFHRHDAKLTVDVVWAPDGLRRGESGGGTVTSNANNDGQIAVRAQMQVLF